MRMRVLCFVENIHQVFNETQRKNGGGAVPIPYPELYQAAIDAFESEEAGFDASDVFEEIVKTLNAENVFSELERILMNF